MIESSRRKLESASLVRLEERRNDYREEVEAETPPSAQAALHADPAGEIYTRPVAAEYEFAIVRTPYHQYLLDSPGQTVCNAILKVVEVEAPIHFKDLASRVAGVWGQSTGSNITARINMWVKNLADSKQIAIKGDFIWNRDRKFVVRSRKGTNIPAERIAPEEVREAILMVLRAGNEFTQSELLKEVRGVFGFSRTGSGLQQVITSVIELLLLQGVIGEGRIGIAIRGTDKAV
ncbi:MAG: DUF3320 domain-containing protein [Pyrinomonadaceae bacterium]